MEQDNASAGSSGAGSRSAGISGAGSRGTGNRSAENLSAGNPNVQNQSPERLNTTKQSSEDASLGDVRAALAFNDDVQKAARNNILPSRTFHLIVGVGFSVYLFFINAPIPDALRYTVVIACFVLMIALAVWLLSTTRVRVAMRQDPYANQQIEGGTWSYLLAFFILMSFMWIPNFVRDSTGATPLWLLIPTSIGGGIYAYVGMSLGFLNPQSDWHKRYHKSKQNKSGEEEGITEQKGGQRR